MHWLLLILALSLNASASLLLKLGSNLQRPLAGDAGLWEKATNFLNAPTVGALVLFAANVLIYRKALDVLDISVAYPVMVSGGLVIVTVVAAVGLRERVTVAQIAGMVLIAAGVWLVVSRGAGGP
jgi:multidrug transporter EmrE-like cation transporter